MEDMLFFSLEGSFIIPSAFYLLSSLHFGRMRPIFEMSATTEIGQKANILCYLCVQSWNVIRNRRPHWEEARSSRLHDQPVKRKQKQTKELALPIKELRELPR